MTLLTCVKTVCRRVGIGAPAAVVTATDDATLQLLELANESAEEIARRHGWSLMRAEKEFSAVPQQAQPNSLPADYGRMAPGQTLWDRSANRRLRGPASPEVWSQLKAFRSTTGYGFVYRIFGGRIQLYPVPGGGETIAYEYLSRLPIIGADGTLREAFAADTDTVRFPEALLVKDLRWRWKAAKGLNYAEEFAVFERAFELEVAADRGEVEIGTASGLEGDLINDTFLNGAIAPTEVVIDGGLVP